jgi:hypothetical protein
VTTRSLEVPLKGFGAAPSRAELVIESLRLKDRMRRAALPIPLVHFVLVPGALVLGLVAGALRLNQREIIRSAEGSCPYCGTPQRLGLAGRVFRLPREVFCDKCRRPLDLGAD